MADGTYNGWANYETWLVNLWISNDQGTLESTKAYLMDDRSDCGGEINGNDAENLKAWVSDVLLETRPDSGFQADLINAALGSVNWLEAAKALLEE